MVGGRGGRNRPPSMIDVAKQAGVSHQTVSRVLNTPDVVRPETRRRIERAMQELGYRRNSQARALKTRSTGLIGVVCSADFSFTPGRLVVAIEEAAREAGFVTALRVIKEIDEEAVRNTVEFFLGHGIESIVVLAPLPEMAEAAQQMAQRLPTVTISSGLDPAGGLHVIRVDQNFGARLATEHLVGLGHRSIAHLAGPHGWYWAEGRIRGWAETLRESGLKDDLLVVSEGWAANDGYAAAQELLTGGVRPGAVFAANDYMALGAIRAFEEVGLRVPDDISVMGYDDVEAAAFFSPSLTTVREPSEQAARAAVDTLIAFAGGASAEHSSLRPELVMRASTTPAHGPR